MSSIALDAKANLIALAEAAASLSSYQKTWGYPTREPSKKWLLVGGIKWSDEDWATNRSREESFEIAMTFNVQVAAGNGQSAEEAVMASAADLEDALKADPRLGIPAIIYIKFVH